MRILPEGQLFDSRIDPENPKDHEVIMYMLKDIGRDAVHAAKYAGSLALSGIKTAFLPVKKYLSGYVNEENLPITGTVNVAIPMLLGMGKLLLIGIMPDDLPRKAIEIERFGSEVVNLAGYALTGFFLPITTCSIKQYVQTKYQKAVRAKRAVYGIHTI